MTAYLLKRKRPPVLHYTDDYTKVGSPTIVDNVVSGFSASNYLITKNVFNPLDADFEFVFKIKLDSHTVNVILAENRTGQFSKVYLCIDKTQKIFFGIGTGSAWRIRVYSNVLLELNIDYWIKVVKSNGTFYIYYSLDGKDYILDNSVENTSVFPSITVAGRIGCWKDSSTGNSYFHGSIDLTESYIKLNGEYWWRGAYYINADKTYVLKKKQYWKNVVTEITKYWKEIKTETTVRELAFACYGLQHIKLYAKLPLGSDRYIWATSSTGIATNVNQLSRYPEVFGSISESVATWGGSYPRDYAHDVYKDVTTTVTEVVEGTPDDYTYTEVETIESIVQSTKDDYDFTTDKSYMLKRKHYWKYEYKVWTQPVLTSDGVIGGDSFATSQTSYTEAGLEAFRAFDGDTSTQCYFTKSTGYFQWYNPNPLKITNLKLTNFAGDAWGTRALTAGSILVSTNGIDFVELSTFTNSATGGGASWDIDLSANTGYYKYYRIVCTGTSYANANAASQCHIAELKITATEQITVPGSATDYDFVTD